MSDIKSNKNLYCKANPETKSETTLKISTSSSIVVVVIVKIIVIIAIKILALLRLRIPWCVAIPSFFRPKSQVHFRNGV